MAKCIKYPSGVIARYDDETARKIVASGAAHFTTKGAWKAFDGSSRRSFAHEEAMKRRANLKLTATRNPEKAARRKAARAKARTSMRNSHVFN